MVEWSSKYFSEADGDTIIHALHMTDRHGGNPIMEGQIDSRSMTGTRISSGGPGLCQTRCRRRDQRRAPDLHKLASATNNWPYDDPMDIIMNIAIGGTLGGDEYVPLGSFNYEMYVDYVRVYQTVPVPTAGPIAPDEPSTGIVAFE